MFQAEWNLVGVHQVREGRILHYREFSIQLQWVTSYDVIFPPRVHPNQFCQHGSGGASHRCEKNLMRACHDVYRGHMMDHYRVLCPVCVSNDVHFWHLHCSRVVCDAAVLYLSILSVFCNDLRKGGNDALSGAVLFKVGAEL